MLELTLKNHIGIMGVLVVICNMIECCNYKPFNNKICPDWYIPTGAAVVVFSFIEIAYWISA